jgi:hypothetical protein
VTFKAGARVVVVEKCWGIEPGSTGTLTTLLGAEDTYAWVRLDYDREAVIINCRCIRFLDEDA